MNYAHPTLSQLAMDHKISSCFFEDKEVKAVWDKTNAKWWFSVPDLIAQLNSQENSIQNHWEHLKAKLVAEQNEILSAIITLTLPTTQDNQNHFIDLLDSDAMLALSKQFPSEKANRLIQWLSYINQSIDSKSKSKAYTFFESALSKRIKVGTIKGLQQIHTYLFGGLYDFAGQIRQKNIAKGGFQFAMVQFIQNTLKQIEAMPANTFDQIVDKYVEMNVAHPFMEGNGRSMRIWFDLMLKKRLKYCVDWSKISKTDYMNAMIQSPTDSHALKSLLQNALTTEVNSLEIFRKGIDYSYYYEQN